MKTVLIAALALVSLNARANDLGSLETARIHTQMLVQSGSLLVQDAYPSQAKIRLAKLLSVATKLGKFECFQTAVSGSIVSFQCVQPVTRRGITRFLNVSGDYIYSRLGDDAYGVNIDEESLRLVIGG